MNKSFHFTGIIHEMAQEEIIGLIDPDKLAEIRGYDTHPQFRAYSIGHEGESSGSLVGIGTVIKRWVKAMIQELSDKIAIGTKVFSGHNKDNSHEGRTVIGELVGKTLKTIKDKLHTIGILYIKPEHRDLKLDVSSIEADAEFVITGAGKVLNADVVKINKIPGIALANSMFSTPGFPGATLQAQIQELTDKEIKMTVDEVKAIIKQEGFLPSELFGKEELIIDPTITEITRDRNKNEYQARKRNQEEFTQIEKDYKKKIEELEGSLKAEKSSRLKIESVDKLKSKIENGRKLDEKQKRFVQLDFDKKFSIVDPEKVDDELDKYIDSRIDEFKKFNELLGLKTDDTGDVQGVGEAKRPLNLANDYTNPEVNDLIPK